MIGYPEIAQPSFLAKPSDLYVTVPALCFVDLLTGNQSRYFHTPIVFV